ncbi:hypothetical protein BROUX41_005813 [Berkeleyomyces rouxiae]|uniref:uncharacterized protein n=1 Tax=Berkeleyomyces rouxiae TaxID=2035830 RepID=UPI003B7EEFF8
MASKTEILHAYRHMYRHLMRAVRNTKPQSQIGRTQLRAAFNPVPGTAEHGQPFDAAGIKRTIWFLKAAEKEAGLEHRVLKNLLLAAGVRQRLMRVPWSVVLKKNPRAMESHKLVQHVYAHYDRTIEMLNKTMGLRLK